MDAWFLETLFDGRMRSCSGGLIEHGGDDKALTFSANGVALSRPKPDGGS